MEWTPAAINMPVTSATEALPPSRKSKIIMKTSTNVNFRSYARSVASVSRPRSIVKHILMNSSPLAGSRKNPGRIEFDLQWPRGEDAKDLFGAFLPSCLSFLAFLPLSARFSVAGEPCLCLFGFVHTLFLENGDFLRVPFPLRPLCLSSTSTCCSASICGNGARSRAFLGIPLRTAKGEGILQHPEKDQKVLVFADVLRSAEEVIVLPPWVTLAVLPRPGIWEYFRVNLHALVFEELTVPEYLHFKKELVDGTANGSFVLELDFEPFNGVEFLNRHLSAKLFHDKESMHPLLEFLKVHCHMGKCTIAHAPERTKYPESDIYWKKMDQKYHFSSQSTTDLIFMNHTDFINTSTYQEIDGVEDNSQVPNGLCRALIDSRGLKNVLVGEHPAAAESFLKKIMETARQISRILAHEQKSSRRQLKQSREEFNELVGVKEVIQIVEQQSMISYLCKEIQSVEQQQLLKENEARKALELNLEEPTRSPDERNQKAQTTSKTATTWGIFSNLVDEKENKSVAAQKKNVVVEAMQNIEDAHSIEKKAKKLEAASASSKGDILGLRRQMTWGKAVAVEHQKSMSVLLKVSGGALAGDSAQNIDPKVTMASVGILVQVNLESQVCWSGCGSAVKETFELN